MTHLQKTLLKLMLFCHVKMFLLKRAPKCKSKNSHYVGLNDEIYETCESCMKRNLLLYRNAVVLIINVHFGQWYAYNQLEYFIMSLNVKRLKITFWPYGLWDQLIAVMPLLSHYTILNNCTLEDETFQEGSKVLEIKRLCADTSM